MRVLDNVEYDFLGYHRTSLILRFISYCRTSFKDQKIRSKKKYFVDNFYSDCKSVKKTTDIKTSANKTSHSQIQQCHPLQHMECTLNMLRDNPHHRFQRFNIYLWICAFSHSLHTGNIFASCIHRITAIFFPLFVDMLLVFIFIFICP